MTERECYFFAGGGTGGHLTPGLAVAAELRAVDRDCRVLFVGSDRPLEEKLVAAAGFEHLALPVEPLPACRHHPLTFAWSSWHAYRMACRLLARESPTAVIGLGGFASVPLVLAATRRKIPTVLLEQNVIPGRATRFLSRRAAVVCTTFPPTASRLPRRALILRTGNPVRSAVADLCRSRPADEPRSPPTLLVLGGSQGAESLNDAVTAMLARRLMPLAGWRIVHQTGASQHDAVAEVYRALSIEHVVQPFFENVADLYTQATLVVSRAGATTLAELACAGCPAVLVPYPQAADNHQLANARLFEESGAATVVEHAALPAATAEQLASTVALLAEDASRRAAMRQAMRKLARPAAARNVVTVLQTLAAETT